MMLIALAAPAGAGKTTVAEMLVKHCGFKRISFAAPLYDMLEAGGFGRPKTPEEKMQVIEPLKKFGMQLTWRHAAQTLGTEWGRHCLGDHIWTSLALSKCSDPYGRYVIDDCRFENEANAVRRIGGMVVHIIGRRADMGTAGTHASEKGVMFDNDSDYRLDNSGSLLEVEQRLVAMLQVAAEVS